MTAFEAFAGCLARVMPDTLKCRCAYEQQGDELIYRWASRQAPSTPENRLRNIMQTVLGRINLLKRGGLNPGFAWLTAARAPKSKLDDDDFFLGSDLAKHACVNDSWQTPCETLQDYPSV